MKDPLPNYSVHRLHADVYQVKTPAKVVSITYFSSELSVQLRAH